MFIWIAWATLAIGIFMSLFWLNILQQRRDQVSGYPEPSTFPSITVLMPAYNEEDVIGEAIDSVLDQDYPADKLELVVINDGSTDGTRDVVQQYTDSDRVTLVTQQNQGKGAALNTGLDHADTDLVAVQDADSVIEEDAFHKMVGHFEKERVGGVIAGIKPLEATSFWTKFQRIEYLIGIIHRRLMAVINTLYVTPGALSLYRRDKIEEVGRFDEQNLTEDLEIALRLKKHHYNIEMTAPAITRTEFPEDFRSLMHQRIRWYRGLLRNTIRYREMMFNRDYGLFGSFQMPLHLIYPIVAITGLFLVIAGITQTLYNTLVWISAVGLALTNPLADMSLYEFFLSLNVMLYFPLVVGAALIGMLLWAAHRYTDETFKHPLSLGGFFIFYYTILGLFWCMAIGHEILQREERW